MGLNHALYLSPAGPLPVAHFGPAGPKLDADRNNRDSPLGGYPTCTLRHTEIRNLTANLLLEVCHNVTIEPTLQPVTRETFKLASTIIDIGARSDIAADGFWGGHFEKTSSEFLTHLLHLIPHPTPNACYCSVLSTTGGMGPIATTFY